MEEAGDDADQWLRESSVYCGETENCPFKSPLCSTGSKGGWGIVKLFTEAEFRFQLKQKRSKLRQRHPSTDITGNKKRKKMVVTFDPVSVDDFCSLFFKVMRVLLFFNKF